jgi:GT2 family glycosyltransferase
MTDRKIGAAIITFNNIIDTLHVVDSLLSSDYKNIELLVVDNKSDEAYKEKLSSELKLKFPSMKLLYINEDKGYGGACNIGAKYLIEKGSEILLFLNNDVSLDKSCVSKLTENIKQDVVLAGPKIYLGFSNILYSAGGFFDKKTLIVKMRGYGKIDKGQYDKREEVEFINGSVFMIDARVFMELGGFDEKFYYYCDESDLCYSLLKAGYKMIYDPQAIAYHCGSKTLGTESRKAYYFMARSTLYFVAKHSKSKQVFLANLLYIINGYLIRMLNAKVEQMRTLSYAVIRGIVDFSKSITGKGPY